MSWNTDGLKNKDSDFFNILTKDTPDIFIFQETWCSEEEASTVLLNFQKSHKLLGIDAEKSSAVGRRKGGMIIGINQNLTYEQIEKTRSYITIKVNNLITNPITIMGCYFAPNQDGEKDFIDFTEKLVNEDPESHLIIGDLNARVGTTSNLIDGDDVNRKSQDNTTNDRGRKLMNAIRSSNISVMNGYATGDEQGQVTFRNKNGTSLIDLCLMSNDIIHLLGNLKVMPCIPSTHHPIVLRLICNDNIARSDDFNGIESTCVTKTAWDPAKCFEFKSILHEKLNSPDQDLLHAVQSSLHDLGMTKEISLPVKKKFKPAWMDKSCEIKKSAANQLLRKARQSNLKEDNEAYWAARNEYNSAKQERRKIAKNETIQNLMNAKDSKTFWSTIKKLRPRTVSDNKVTAAQWVNFYKNTFETANLPPPIFDNNVEQLDHPISTLEISLILKKLKSNKAPGNDGIPNEVWRSLPPRAILFMSNLFNSILEKGTIPDDWTLIFLKPLFKKGEPTQPSNYRPIALATTILKCFTSILTARLQRWTEKNNLVTEFQAGFRKGMGTLEQILCLLTLIQSKLRKPAGKLFAIFIDARMAFDSCRHDKLWRVLKRRGISSKLLNILVSLYSSARGQVYTPIGLTHPFYFQRGVLQGEPASSTLFNLFINGLASRLEKSKVSPVKIGSAKFHCLKFADDICLVANSSEDLQIKINIAAEFFQDRSLNVNIQKTKILIFSKMKAKNNFKFKWDEDDLEIVDEYVYLGILFHRNGTFKQAKKIIFQKASAASANVVQITRKSAVPHLDVHIRLFHSLARSTLLYAAPIWALQFRSEIDKIQTRFLKKTLRLPITTPDYFIRIETNAVHTGVQLFQDTLNFLHRTIIRPDSSPVKQCLIAQLNWQKINSSHMERKHCWAEGLKEMLQDCNYRQPLTELLNVTNFKRLSKSLPKKMMEHLLSNDKLRMNQSTFIPHYQYIKSTDGREEYFNKGYPPQKCSLFAQLRLNKFSIKLGNSIIRLDTRCPLCGYDSSVQHYLFECRPISKERNQLIKPLFLSTPPPASAEELYLLLFSQDVNQMFANNMFLFWCAIDNFIKLCTD